MADLVGGAASEADRRAMQRRIKKLVDLGRVKGIGSRKATRYFTLDQQPPRLFIMKKRASKPREACLSPCPQLDRNFKGKSKRRNRSVACPASRYQFLR